MRYLGDCCDEVRTSCADLSFCEPPVECLDNSITAICSRNANLTTEIALETAGWQRPSAQQEITRCLRPRTSFRGVEHRIRNCWRMRTFWWLPQTRSQLEDAAALSGVLHYATERCCTSVEVTDAGLVINGNALVTIADIQASNGIVHVINAVIIEEEPPAPGLCEWSRCRTATATSSACSLGLLRGCLYLLSSPQTAVEHRVQFFLNRRNCGETELHAEHSLGSRPEDHVLHGGDFTVFAPTNQRSQLLGIHWMQYSDQGLLTSILTSDRYLPRRMVDLVPAVATLNERIFRWRW